jgi:CRP-like cAMP-binding protein
MMASRRQKTHADESLLRLNQEAFEAGAEMQMAMLEASSRWATEITTFMARRAQATARDVARLATATTPREVVGAQLDRMNTMARDYAQETGRLLDIANQSTHEGAAGVRSAWLDEGSKPQ